MAVKKGLGKGLDSLITNKIERPLEVIEGAKANKEGAVLVNITKVEPNRDLQ